MTEDRDVAARLREAMSRHAAQVTPSPARWEEIEAQVDRARRRHRRRRFGYLSLAVAAGVAAVGLAVATLEPSSSRRVVTVAPVTRPTAPETTAPASPSQTAPGPAATLPAPYQPLWPFSTGAEVEAWQAAYRAGGQQPWHLDPAATALSFTTGYLGYGDINRVADRAIGATDARISVGYAAPSESSQPLVAAVIHLVRFGTGPDAPWEVVGTDDTRGMSVTSPRYGSGVTSPVTVGGRITGVDESIHVRVLQPSSGARPLGDRCCLPAGGSDTPWSTTVAFSGAKDPVLTIVAATGGHLTAVERFSVTAARA